MQMGNPLFELEKPCGSSWTNVKQPTDSEGRARSSKYENYFYSISYFTANFLRSFKDKTNTLFSGFLILQLSRYVQFHI